MGLERVNWFSCFGESFSLIGSAVSEKVLAQLDQKLVIESSGLIGLAVSEKVLA